MNIKKPYEALRIQVSRVAGLSDIGSKFSEAVKSDHLLSLILKQTLDLMNAEVCIIWLKDKEGNLIPRMSFGLKTYFIESAKVKVVSGFIKCIMEKDDLINISNLEKDKRVPLKQHIKEESLKSLLASPLVVGDERIGVLMVCTKRERRFTKVDLKVFDALTKQSALAIADIGLFERKAKTDYLNAIKTLAKVIDANDIYTRGHCDKVMRYSLVICKRLNLTPRHTNTIKTASLLHDIGKIGVDLSIIRKRGKLNAKDWENVRKHPEIGARIIRQVGFLNDLVPIIRYHHSRFDGGGYPDPDKSDGKIPLGARIIAVADAFAAMTSGRPYRKAMSKEKALSELKRCAGSQFDPAIVNVFVSAKHN